jgi:hypothetical protein
LFTGFDIKPQSISLETGLVNHHDYFETPILFYPTSALLETMDAFFAIKTFHPHYLSQSQPDVKTKKVSRR